VAGVAMTQTLLQQLQLQLHHNVAKDARLRPDLSCIYTCNEIATIK